MDDMEPTRRRRRRRGSAPQGPPPPATVTSDTTAPPVPPEAPRPAAGKRRAREGGPERGLRDLVGAGHSQVGVSGALRARDVNRPTEEDLAEADRDVVIVRRNWKPDQQPH